MSTRRTRKRLLSTVAVLMVAGLVSAGCGSRVGASGPGGSSAGSCVDTSGNSVKVGFLNSLSGTMAISEKTVHDSLLLAADQINSSGGVLGKQLTVVSEDGASEPTTFAEKAAEWHYDGYWNLFRERPMPGQRWDVPPWLHAYSHVNTFAIRGPPPAFPAQ